MSAPPSSPPDYPWFSVVSASDIQQGDIFEDMPIIVPSAEDFSDEKIAEGKGLASVSVVLANLIVITQSCDLAQDPYDHVLFCAFWTQAELVEAKEKVGNASQMDAVRQGRRPAFHMLSACDLAGFKREVRIVDFRLVHSLPFSFLAERTRVDRLRLMPPYREHLSQGLARYFMRVGLPSTIPPFKSKPPPPSPPPATAVKR